MRGHLRNFLPCTKYKKTLTVFLNIWFCVIRRINYRAEEFFSTIAMNSLFVNVYSMDFNGLLKLDKAVVTNLAVHSVILGLHALRYYYNLILPIVTNGC